MQGIDGKFALLKMAQTHLCVKWKKIIDKDLSLSQADAEYFEAVEAGFGLNYATISA